MRNYQNISAVEQRKMCDYYKTHTLDETAVFFRIEDRTGLAQYLSRNAQKTTLGGARHKVEVSEFLAFKNEVISKLGKEGKYLIEKLLKLHVEELKS